VVTILMSLINCKDVSLAYDGNIVLSDVNFQLNSGDYLCVVGENGSGKSTLIKGLLRLKSPVSGEIVFSDGLYSSHIGYMPQQSAAQRDFPATVFEVVLSGRLNSRRGKPFYSKSDRQEVSEKLYDVGMEGLKKHSYQELSGGQQQRVAISRAVVAGPKLILADEPTGNLDSKNGLEVMNLLTDLNRAGTTIVMVTHSVENAGFAHRVINLFDGQIITESTQGSQV